MLAQSHVFGKNLYSSSTYSETNILLRSFLGENPSVRPQFFFNHFGETIFPFSCENAKRGQQHLPLHTSAGFIEDVVNVICVNQIDIANQWQIMFVNRQQRCSFCL